MISGSTSLRHPFQITFDRSHGSHYLYLLIFILFSLVPNLFGSQSIYFILSVCHLKFKKKKKGKIDTSASSHHSRLNPLLLSWLLYCCCSYFFSFLFFFALRYRSCHTRDLRAGGVGSKEISQQTKSFR
jgi:hypothetical protein